MRHSLSVLAVLVAMCGGCVSAVQSDRSLAPGEGAQLVYFRDARTGLCFAGKNFWTQAAMIATVPCTDAVLRLIAYYNNPPAQ